MYINCFGYAGNVRTGKHQQHRYSHATVTELELVAGGHGVVLQSSVDRRDRSGICGPRLVCGFNVEVKV